MIRLIAGISLDRAIGVYEGKKGKLPWGLKDARGDLALFRHVTDGDVVIMGRKTFESIGSKPLANRENIVVTSKLMKNQATRPSVREAIDLAQSTFTNKNIWIMGGSEVFREAMDYADEIFLTVIPFKAYQKFKPSQLVYFPTVNEKRFNFFKCEEHPINSRLRIIRYGTSKIEETIDDLRRDYKESSKKVRGKKPENRRRKTSNRKNSPRSNTSSRMEVVENIQSVEGSA